VKYLTSCLYDIVMLGETVGDAATIAEQLDRLAAATAEFLGVRSCQIRLHDPTADRAVPEVWTAITIGDRLVGELRIVERPLLRRRAGRLRTGTATAARTLGASLDLLGQRALADHDSATLAEATDALWAARRLAIQVQSDERRALERNLHDGVQHHLVTLRLELSVLGLHLSKGDAATARDRLRRTADLIGLTGRALIETAAGALPETLVRDGLCAAVRAELHGTDAVTVTADEAFVRRRYPLVVEAAAFFACMEAVNNAHKHAGGSVITIDLADVPSGFTWSVRDAGTGFDPGALNPTSGLNLVRERIAAAGGTLTVESTMEVGTTVSAVMRV
jgi:signal transduction histidine kinase